MALELEGLAEGTTLTLMVELGSGSGDDAGRHCCNRKGGW